MKYSKFPLFEIVLSTIGIFVSVVSFVLIQVAGKMEHASTGPSPLAILELVMFVLFVAALTSKRPLFTRIVSIVALANILLASFITAIVCSTEFQSYNVTWDTISFLTISLVSLVAIILCFIYFLIGRKGTTKALAKVMNLFSLFFTFVFAILLFLSAFLGVYKSTPLYAVNMGLLLINVCIAFGVLFSLQNTITVQE